MGKALSLVRATWRLYVPRLLPSVYAHTQYKKFAEEGRKGAVEFEQDLANFDNVTLNTKLNHPPAPSPSRVKMVRYSAPAGNEKSMEFFSAIDVMQSCFVLVAQLGLS
jgi:hypothetical protein